MGTTKWSARAYSAASSTLRSKSTREVYKASFAPETVRADKIEYREARDSQAHPNSVPIIIGLDVSGSMGFIADDMAKNSLGPIVQQAIDRFNNFDPHILFAAIGDAVWRDQYPFQATQFETDIKILDQLTSLYLEHGGGGNSYESYDLAWAFAANKTRTDAWDKRKKKGYLFTIGDEEFPHAIGETYYRESINGNRTYSSPDEVLREASERYHVFHIDVLQGNYNERTNGKSLPTWEQRLGNRALPLANYRHVSSVIIAAIAINEGEEVSDVVDSFQDPSVRSTVAAALRYKG